MKGRSVTILLASLLCFASPRYALPQAARGQSSQDNLRATPAAFNMVNSFLNGNKPMAQFLSGLFAGGGNCCRSLPLPAPADAKILALWQHLRGTMAAQRGTFAGAAPQDVEPLLPTTITGVDATSDTSVNAALAAGFQLSGMINGPPGAFAFSVVAIAIDGSGSFSSGVNFFTSRYLIVLPAGTYNLEVSFTPSFPFPGPTLTFDDPTPVVVSADTTRDVTLPAVTIHNVSGTVSPLDLFFDSKSVSFSSADGKTFDSSLLNPGGSYQGQLPDGNYAAGLFEFSSATMQGTTINLGSLTVSGGDVMMDFTVPATAHLSGTVSFADGSPIPPNSSAFALASGPLNFGLSPINPSSGAYQAVLATGHTYMVGATLPITLGGQSASLTFILPEAIDFEGETTQNISLPALPVTSMVSGQVTDPNGVGVSNTQVSASTQQVTGAPNTFLVASTATDPNGNYNLAVLSGTNYTLRFSPPRPAP